MGESIWEEAGASLYLTDEDFESEFGRPRTEDEKTRHQMFTEAAILADPGSTLEFREEKLCRRAHLGLGRCRISPRT